MSCFNFGIKGVFVSCSVLTAMLCILYGNREEAYAQEKVLNHTSLLEDIRESAARNEASFSLIKMDWKVRIEKSIPESQIEQVLPREIAGRKRGTPYTHYMGTWAQDGIKQYINQDNFSGLDTWERGDIKVMDGEVKISASKPDLLGGTISEINTFRKDIIPMMHLGILPHGRQYKLSDLLVPEYATIHRETEIIDGRKAYILDVQKPNRTPPRFARIWIDCERGMPLRMEYYNKDLNSEEYRLKTEITSIKLHQLPNGGWFPVEGTRVLHRHRSIYYTVSEHITVDVNSITIQREDIPDSLFTIEFPENARVYNAITGFITEGGRIWNPKLESIIDDSIETLDISSEEPEASPLPDQELISKVSQEISQKTPVNEPTLSENDKTTGSLADVEPAAVRGRSIVWILLPAFLAAFALTIIILMFRSPIRNIGRRDVK